VLFLCMSCRMARWCRLQLDPSRSPDEVIGSKPELSWTMTSSPTRRYLASITTPRRPFFMFLVCYSLYLAVN
jgi:hypothetical protein